MTEEKISELRAYLIGVLQTLDQKIKYLEAIVSYPVKHGKKHFEPSDDIATFFKSSAIALYTEICCLIVNHLHNKQANKFVDLSIVSDWNEVFESTEYKNVKIIRDQFAGHQDSNNPNNGYSSSRSVGEINSQRVVELRELLKKIVNVFKSIEQRNGKIYLEAALEDAGATVAVENILKLANPKTTNA